MIVLIGGLLTGCTDHRGAAAAPPAGSVSGSAVPPAKSFDPPTRFRKDKGVRLPAVPGDVPAPPVLLYQTTLVAAAPDHLDVVDALTGRTRATPRPPDDPVYPAGRSWAAGTDPARPPVPAQVDGRAVAVAPFLVRAGTRRLVDLLVVDLTTGQATRTVPVELGAQAKDDVTPQALGVYDHTLVLTVRDGSRTDTYGVDLAARKVAWSRPFAPDLVAGDVLVAGGDDGAVALSVTDGTPRWTYRKGGTVYVRNGGPNLLVTTGRTAGGGNDYFFDLLDPSTGAPRYTSGGGGSDALRCRYDERSAIVCWQDTAGGRWIGGYDPASGQPLWQLPNSADDRGAPDVTAVWHGAVYGNATNGPVVLDARTGADREAAPGAAPDLVDEYVGVVHDKAGNTLTAYPAAG